MIDEDQIIASAMKQEERLASRAQFDMLRAGRKDTADMLDDPQAKEMLARSALARAVMDHVPSEKPKGPARRKPPKVSARKRQRQARKRSRR